MHSPAKYIDGIELMQYSLMNAPDKILNREQLNWITFFKRGHYMSEEKVSDEIETLEVLKAFDYSRIKAIFCNVGFTYFSRQRFDP